jgi:hypothetical protein
VNLAAAAISFFYRETSDLEKTIGKIKRMKPGTQLPNVYGQSDMEDMLCSITKLNLKKRYTP